MKNLMKKIQKITMKNLMKRSRFVCWHSVVAHEPHTPEHMKIPNLQLSTFNLQPSTFNFQPSTFNVQPSTFNFQLSTFQPATNFQMNIDAIECRKEKHHVR
jgi:hypothetical protein